MMKLWAKSESRELWDLMCLVYAELKLSLSVHSTLGKAQSLILMPSQPPWIWKHLYRLFWPDS